MARRYAWLAADLARASTAAADALTLALEPGTYAFEADGAYSSSATTIGYKAGFVLNGGALGGILYNIIDGASSNTGHYNATAVAGTLLGTTTTAAVNNYYPFRLGGMIVVTAAGVLAFQHAASGAGTVTTRALSKLWAERVA